MKMLLIAVGCLVAVVLGSPIIEQLQDTLVFEAAVTKTCWDIHGYYFPGRWGCRSTYNQMGMKDVSIRCLINGKDDQICLNIEAIAAANKPQPRPNERKK